MAKSPQALHDAKSWRLLNSVVTRGQCAFTWREGSASQNLSGVLRQKNIVIHVSFAPAGAFQISPGIPRLSQREMSSHAAPQLVCPFSSLSKFETRRPWVQRVALHF